MGHCDETLPGRLKGVGPHPPQDHGKQQIARSGHRYLAGVRSPLR
ncbi:MAG: hypothetical protein OXG06_00580 [Gammaproteobacteria bacterium]|nr:hypothetical protein [Gammaproteobacteria bacterium]